MSRKLEVYQDGLDIIIRIPNAGRDITEVLKDILHTEDAIKKLEGLIPEDYREEENLTSQEVVQMKEFKPSDGIPKIIEGEFAGMTAYEVLLQKGPVSISPLYAVYKTEMKKENRDVALLRDIKADLSQYLQEKCEGGYDATNLTDDEIRNILIVNKAIFRKPLEFIYQKAGVTDFDSFLSASSETLRAGALTYCMNEMAKAFNS